MSWGRRRCFRAGQSLKNVIFARWCDINHTLAQISYRDRASVIDKLCEVQTTRAWAMCGVIWCRMAARSRHLAVCLERERTWLVCKVCGLEAGGEASGTTGGALAYSRRATHGIPRDV